MRYKSRAGMSKEANSEFVIIFIFQRVIPVAQSDRAGEVTTQRCDTHSSGLPDLNFLNKLLNSQLQQFQNYRCALRKNEIQKCPGSERLFLVHPQ